MPEITANVSLAPYTTFKIGGPAKYFAIAKSLSELQDLIAFAKTENQALLVIGGGSNVLISDSGFFGLVIKLELVAVTYEALGDDVLVTAESGLVFDRLVEETVNRGLWGLENLSHIPGSVGATPIQNVGAYGTEVSNLITSVTVLDTEKNLLQAFTNEQCQFYYRDSLFKKPSGKKYIVVAVTYRLSKAIVRNIEYKDLKNYFLDQPNPNLTEIRAAVIAIRSQKFPDWNIIGTAGSFFKNPIISQDHYQELQLKYPDLPGYFLPEAKVKVPLGWILDKICNLRGYRLGVVGTYQTQSMVVVNHGQATATEVKDFAQLVTQKVFDTTKIKIDWEVTEIK